MKAKRNCQYYIQFQNKVKAKSKSTKLQLYFGQFDNIPVDIIHKEDNSKIIVEGQKRVYLDRNDKEIVLDEGYESMDIISSFLQVSNLKIEVDRLCDTDTKEFIKQFDEIVNRIHLSSEFKLHFKWYNNSDDHTMEDILNKFKQNHTITKLKFNVNSRYLNVVKSITATSLTLNSLSLVFPSSDYIPSSQENELLFYKAITSIKTLQRFSIDCQGENCFKFLVDSFTHNFKTNSNSNSNRREIEGKGDQEWDRKQGEQEKEYFPKIKQFNFNLECIDFIPEHNDLLKLLPALLISDPRIKFRIKFPYALQYHTQDNAFKIYNILETYEQIFSGCKQIAAFTFSTAGNKHYLEEKNQSNHDEQPIMLSSRAIIMKGILKKSSSLIRSEVPRIDSIYSLHFLNGQKQLQSLTLKFDQQIDLSDLSKLLLSVSNSLQRLNLRVRNNNYTRIQLDKFMGNINALIHLSTLCLDIQFVEYIFFKINSSSLTKLVKYKQGRMVKRCTDYTVNQIFRNDPVDLLNFFNQFKMLMHFDGQFPGFEFCQDYYRYYLDPSTYEQCINVSKMCEQIFYQKLLYRKLFLRIILAMQVQVQLTKSQVNQIFNQFYSY